MPSSTRVVGLTLAAAGWALAPVPAAALEATASVGHTAEYTSNSARTDNDEVEEWIHRPSFQLGLRQEGAQLEMDLGYQIERRIYEEDLFDDETAITGEAAVLWRALPERLDFTLRNVRTESTERALTPSTENNRQTVSTTDVGPTLRLQPRSNAELQAEYLFTDVSVDETDTDSERHNGTLRYVVDLSSVRSVTLEGTYRQVDFDNPVAPDLDTTVGTVNLTRTEGMFEYSLTGGYNLTQREQGRDDVDGAILDAVVNWNATPLTVVDFQASRQIRDSSSMLVAGASFGDEVREDTDLNEVFTESRAAIGVRGPLGNNQLSLVLSGSEEDYEDVLRDSERYGLLFGLTREINPRTTLTLSLEAARREFTDEGFEQDEYRGDLRVERTLGRRLTVGLGVRYDEWDADLEERSYREWIGGLSLRYDLLMPR